MVGQGPLKPLILVRIQAREPHYLLTMSRIGHADDPIPPIPFKQHIFHTLGQCHIWDFKRIGKLLVKGSRGTGKCYRSYPRIYWEFCFRSGRKFHPIHVQCEICTYIAFLVNWKLDDARYERSDAWSALCNPDRKSHRNENSAHLRKSIPGKRVHIQDANGKKE